MVKPAVPLILTSLLLSLSGIASTVDVELEKSADATTWSPADAGSLPVTSSAEYYRLSLKPTGGAVGSERYTNALLVDPATAGTPAHVLIESSPDLTAWTEEGEGTFDITGSKQFFRMQTGPEFLTVEADGDPVDTFQIARFEVTQELWGLVLTWANANGYDLSNGTLDCDIGNHPMNKVNWNNAVKWCNARSELDNLAPVYYLDAVFSTLYRTGDAVPSTIFANPAATGYRLPTIIEWQFAATGGGLSQGFDYSGSDTVGDVSRHSGNSSGSACSTTTQTWPVGNLGPSELGTYDMSGSVSEWVYDRVFASDTSRDLFGGHWSDLAAGTVVLLSEDLDSTDINAVSDEISVTGALNAFYPEVYLLGVDLPEPLVERVTYYYTETVADTTAYLSASLGGPAIDLTDAGSGTFRLLQRKDRSDSTTRTVENSRFGFRLARSVP